MARKVDPTFQELIDQAKNLGAKRVLVITPKGKRAYKDLDKVNESDDIQLTAAGLPIVMATSPGRPRKVDTSPSTAVLKDTIKRRSDLLRKDPIIRALNQQGADDVLAQVIVGIGEEVASLAFEKMEAERAGKDTSQLSARRVSALRIMGDTWIKRLEQVSSKVIDLDGLPFRRTFGYVIETFRETLTFLGYRDEEIDTVIAKFASYINDDWKAEARNRMKT